MEDKKTAIYQSGKTLFSEHGFKDTNVAGITQLAGVSVGTFYNYYSSKEKLFMEIFLEENAKLKEQVMGSIDLNADPLTTIKALMAANLSGMSAHPILREWYNRDVFSRIEQQYIEDNGTEAVDFVYGSSIQLVRSWQAQGKMRADMDAELIMAMFASLIQVDMHKAEIGVQHFPQILDHLAEFIVDGLTK
ncbi:TetR/AcrR family transcriptional regulator [Paenibacillus donghaensis]|uniref:TetR family transcriptional regulator n=1 Tax=Paenibacillus donghaensis TaxID=414771 RepID=A0A2Z2K9Q9_9BACL|nr:TetR/AcrR family transcriptional regulator [Paenibacillus donghaensis]ASA20205.1 TetR family transcriptional regulator [Paenibacillus donghaensis]